jgi:hypothetical protein
MDKTHPANFKSGVRPKKILMGKNDLKISFNIITCRVHPASDQLTPQVCTILPAHTASICVGERTDGRTDGREYHKKR